MTFRSHRASSICRPRTSAGVGLLMSAGLVAIGCVASTASGQQGVPGTAAEQLPKAPAGPLDINKPSTDNRETEPTDDGPTYRVSGFELKYVNEHPEHPAPASVGEAMVKLGVSPTGYVVYRENVPGVTLRVADVIEGTRNLFHASAIRSVTSAIAADLHRRGLAGVSVQIDPEDINEDGVDQRPAERSTLHLLVFTAKARRVDTLAVGPRLGSDDARGDQVSARFDLPDPVHRRIRGQSPVQPGDLLWQNRVDDFAFRLNRHPGRSVRAEFAPLTGPNDPEAAELTYRIFEAKPWSIYAQLSNTGTKQTNEWRERFGFVHNQLTSHDDIFRVDYVTAGFEDTHALTGSYQFPLLSDRIFTRLFGAYSQFDASQVGLAGDTFNGETWQAGFEVTGLVYQHRDWFIDVLGGVRYQSVQVTDGLIGATGEGEFVIPYVGARVERTTAAMSTSAGLSIETNVSNVDQTDLDLLGRLDADDKWTTLKYDASQSIFLGPTFDLGKDLAHEVVGRFRGQMALGGRLIPNEQDTLGGMYTVRGYPESASAGDSAFVATLEYRYHVPRGFAMSEPGTLGKRRMATGWPFGADFRWAPQEPFGTTDWDLVLSGFLDYGRTTKNDRLLGETDGTLMSVGIGAELQLRNNASVRLDWGVALEDLNESGQTVDSGDNRIHFLLTFLY